jgi:hypothetical protein
MHTFQSKNLGFQQFDQIERFFVFAFGIGVKKLMQYLRRLCFPLKAARDDHDITHQYFKSDMTSI